MVHKHSKARRSNYKSLKQRRQRAIEKQKKVEGENEVISHNKLSKTEHRIIAEHRNTAKASRRDAANLKRKKWKKQGEKAT